MKSKAYGWLAAAVLAAGLNASYHDGGLEWAHRAVDGIGHNVSAVLALASGHADQFLIEARLAIPGNTAETKNVSDNETTSCRLATAWARIQTRFAQGQTRLARMQTNFIQTRLAHTELADSNLAHAQSAWDQFEARSEARSDEMSARQEAATSQIEARIEAQRARREAETEHHLQARIAEQEMAEERMAARIRPVAAMQKVNWEAGCQHFRVSVPHIRIPQVHVPEINVPDVHIPQIHVPDFNVPSVSVDAGPGPV